MSNGLLWAIAFNLSIICYFLSRIATALEKMS